MADFRMQKSFGIDDGELDGLSPQQCFVLGYELAQLDTLLRRPAGFNKPVHAANRARIEASCQAENREFRLDWMADDPSESWLSLTVMPSGRDGSADDRVVS